MTMTTEPVVSQEDREAALAFCNKIGRVRADLYGDAIRRGEWDHTDEVQAFKNHRLSALTEARAREENKPRRRIVATISMEADDWDEVRAVLRRIQTDMALEDGQLRNMVSGGYASGYAIAFSEDASITHDSWRAKLEAHLATLKEHINDGR